MCGDTSPLGSDEMGPKRKARKAGDELLTIPGVGTAIARDLKRIGIRRVSDLRDRDPEALYTELIRKAGQPIDHCMLYVLRCAVYFASRTVHDPARLNWWNWKDPVPRR